MPHFQSTVKQKGNVMKVLIRLNHGLDKSLLLDLKESVSPGSIREILDSADQERAVQQLLAGAAHVHEI